MSTNSECPALRRAVVHAAVEMRMLSQTVGEQKRTPHSVAFRQGVDAAVDTMDMTFKRHFANVNPSQYAHALERSFEGEHLRFLEARAMLVAMAEGHCFSHTEINEWLNKYPIDTLPGSL